jgi:thiol-disulfide isomerase/thioredoxin
MRIIWRYIGVFLLAGIFEIALSLVRGGMGFNYSSVIGFVTFFLSFALFNFYNKRFNPAFFLLSLVLGVSLIHLPPRIIAFNETLISLPDYLCHLLGICFGYLFILSGSSKRWLVSLTGAAIMTFVFFNGYNLWLHKLNFGSYTGKVKYHMPEFRAQLSDSSILDNNNFNNKIIILDFWHTQCGACFRKFPKLEALYQRFSRDTNFSFYAVNIPLPNDGPSKAWRMIVNRGYTFPVAKSLTIQITDSLKIEAFPTTIICDKNGDVVFKGSIENAAEIIDSFAKIE